MVKSKYRSRMFISFMIIFVGFSVVGVTAMNVEHANSEMKEQQIAIERQLNLIKQDLSTQFLIMFKHLEELRGSEELSSWSGSKGGQYYYHMRRVQELLAEELINIPSIEYYLGIAFKEDEASIVTSKESLIKEEYFERFGMDGDAVYEMGQKIRYMSKDRENIVIQSSLKGGDAYLHFVSNGNYFNQDIVFYLTISKGSLAKIFEGLEGYWFIVSDEANILVETLGKEESLDPGLLGHLWQRGEYEGNLGSKMTVDQNRLIYTMPFSMVNWRLVHISDEQRLAREEVLIYFLIPMILLVIISVALSRWLSSVLYKPIMNLMTQMTDETSEDKGSRDEFEWIIHETNLLKQTNSQMEELIQYNEKKLTEGWLRELVNGDITGNANYDKSVFDHKRSYMVALIELRVDEEDFNKDEKLLLVKNDIRASVMSRQPNQYLSMGANEVVIIHVDMNPEEVKNELAKMIAAIEEETTVDFKIALGQQVKGYLEIASSYEKALALLEYKYLLPKQLILSEALLTSLDIDKGYSYPLALENRIIHCAVNGDEKVLEHLNEVFEENMIRRQLGKRQRKNLTIAIKGTLSRVLQELKATPEEIFKEKVSRYENLEYQWHDDSLEDQVLELFGCLINKLKEDDHQLNDQLQDDMMQYIYDNYADDIMLNDMAEALNLSVKYCSALFKKLTGNNFKDSLNHHRIEVAKSLLMKEEEIKIADLADQVGFNSSNTFIRVFKKYVGVSPGTYAKGKL